MAVTLFEIVCGCEVIWGLAIALAKDGFLPIGGFRGGSELALTRWFEPSHYASSAPCPRGGSVIRSGSFRVRSRISIQYSTMA